MSARPWQSLSTKRAPDRRTSASASAASNRPANSASAASARPGWSGVHEPAPIHVSRPV